jgi:transcriptional regulator with XRE-family HTH domain
VKLLAQVLREKQGKTRNVVGKTTGLGASAITAIETGRLYPWPGMLTKLSDELGHTGPATDLLEVVEP